MLFACKHSTQASEQLTFETLNWKTASGEAFPYREKMLKNLLDSVKLKGLKYAEVIKLLGQPERIDNGHLFYPVSRSEVGALTLHTTTLVIKLNKDSIVEWRKLHG